MSVKRAGVSTPQVTTAGVTQVSVPALNQVLTEVNIGVPVSTMAYHHAQNTPSNSWIVRHNLGFYPNVTTVDSTGTIVEGEIAYHSVYEITVNFSSPFSGHAYLS